MRVAEKELKEAGLQEVNVSKTVAERFLAQELSIPNREDVQKQVHEAKASEQNEISEAVACDNTAAMQANDSMLSTEDTVDDIADATLPEVSYPLRNRGIEVDNNSWVMPRVLEYQR